MPDKDEFTRYDYWKSGWLWLPVIFLIALTKIIAVDFETWELRSQFGETAGAYGVIFSGIALVILVITLYIQRQQYNTQREELYLMKNEIASQTDVIRDQRISSMFFSLIEEKTNTITSFRVPKNQSSNQLQGYQYLSQKLLDKQQVISNWEASFAKIINVSVALFNGEYLQFSKLAKINLRLFEIANEQDDNIKSDFLKTIQSVTNVDEYFITSIYLLSINDNSTFVSYFDFWNDEFSIKDKQGKVNIYSFLNTAYKAITEPSTS